MTGKERLMAAVHGEKVDHLPWAPRIDMWFNAHKRRGTLPVKYKDMSIWDVIRDIGGDLYFNSGPVYKEIIHEVEVVEEIAGDTKIVKDLSSVATNLTYGDDRLSWELSFPTDRKVYYKTPLGTVSQRFIYLPNMELDGVTVPYQNEHWIKGPDDYAVVEYIIEHTEIIPQHDQFIEQEKDFGDEGIVMGFTDYSPFHKIMREYMGYEKAIFEINDNPNLVDQLYQVQLKKHREIIEIATQSPAEIIQMDSNWNEIISPPIFKKYFIPYFQECTNVLHKKNKLVSTHTDGEMKHILPIHQETGLDIAECLTPAPMCEFTLEDARKAFNQRTAIWGGLPAIIFSETFSDEDFYAFMDYVGEVIQPGRRIVLGMGDNLPIDAKTDRLYWITEWTQKYRMV